MMSKVQASFDVFMIDPDLGFFHKDGTKLALRPKELSVLCLLVKYAGELVTKKQIVNEVWDGVPASDESIARCISVIKACLSHAKPNSEYLIKTEYGRGYRFIGDVTFLPNAGKEKYKSITAINAVKVSEVASKNILTCDPRATVLEVANLLSVNRKSSVVVLDDQKPVGIWTEADALTLDLADPHILQVKLSEVMHSPVITIQAHKSISDAASLMRQKGIRHLVVLDNAGKAYGVVSQSDIVYSHGVESFLTVKDVKSIAYQNPLVIKENLPVSEVVSQMCLKHTDILVIELEGRPMFAFTERDVVTLIADQALHVFVGDLNLHELTTIKEDNSILVARQLMDIKKIKHLAVVNQEGHFVKILGLSDILTSLEGSYIQLMEDILGSSKADTNHNGYTQLLASAMQQTAGMVIITDRYGDIDYVNEAFEKCSGYRLDEITGKNPRFLSAGSIPKSVFSNMWETLISGKIWKGELCNQKKSGEKYWVLSSITPIVNKEGEVHHFIAVEEDISERKEVELRLLQIEQRFYDMVDHELVMVWESDQNGKVHFLNKQWLAFTGRHLSEQVGNGWAEQLHPDDLPVFLEVFQQALITRSSFCFDHRLKNAAGDYRWVMNLGTPRTNQVGDFLGFKGTCVDITDRKLREMEALGLAS